MLKRGVKISDSEEREERCLFQGERDVYLRER